MNNGFQKNRFNQLLQHSKAPPSRTGYKRNMAKYVVGCTFFGSLDVFGWHVFFPGPSVATDLRTIGGWGLVLDFHILESYGPTKMPSKSKPIPNGSPHGVFEKSREFQSFRTRTWMSLGPVVLLLLLKKQPSYSLLFDSFSSTLKSKVFKSQQHIHVVLRCPVETH